MLFKTKYREDLQILRGFAVVSVVLFHMNSDWFPNGYLGVDIFFIISGYVVTPMILEIFRDEHSQNQTTLKLINFYKRRIFRLAPALGATLIIFALFFLILIVPGDHPKFAIQGLATLFLVGNYGAFKYSRDYFSPGPSPLVHTWSLSVEEQIYIFLPIVLLVLNRKFKISQKIMIWLYGIITVISLIFFVFSNILTPLALKLNFSQITEFNFYGAHSRIWEFSIGGIVYLHLNNRKKELIRVHSGINQVVVFLLIILMMGFFDLESRLKTILVVFLTLFVIYFQSCFAISKILQKTLRFIGDRSYSIYLIHMPLFYIVENSPVLNFTFSNSKILLSILACLMSFTLGSVMYSKIEVPNRKSYAAIELTKRDFRKVFLRYITLPICFLLLLLFSSSKYYWGLDRSIKIPVAWQIDLSCPVLSTNPDSLPCIYSSATSSKKVLLIGDSHAAQFSQAVIEAARRADWNAVIWTMPACTLQFTSDNGLAIYEDCLKRNLNIRNWIKEYKPDLVVVSQYIAFNKSITGMKNGLIELKRISKRVVLIENTPVFKNSFINDSLILDWSKENSNPISKVKLSEMDESNLRASDELALWARSQGLETKNLKNLFCDDKYCYTRALKGWLFSDISHLSLLGAEIAIPVFMELLHDVSIS